VAEPILRKVDAVTVRVTSLDAGLAFYVDRLGHRLLWRNDKIGQVGLALRDSDTEIVLTTSHGYEPNWLVDSVDDAAAAFVDGGGRALGPAFDIAVGRVAVVADPFDNVLVLVDLSKGRYTVDPDGTVTGVDR
jgi:catechol 2,3-dioxygenase-like lactoylglutathione lyase family enzyme